MITCLWLNECLQNLLSVYDSIYRVFQEEKSVFWKIIVSVPVFERARTFHDLERAATVIGTQIYLVITER
jgi:hypothetical protein